MKDRKRGDKVNAVLATVMGASPVTAKIATEIAINAPKVINNMTEKFSRREFLKIAGIASGVLAFAPASPDQGEIELPNNIVFSSEDGKLGFAGILDPQSMTLDLYIGQPEIFTDTDLSGESVEATALFNSIKLATNAPIKIVKECKSKTGDDTFILEAPIDIVPEVLLLEKDLKQTPDTELVDVANKMLEVVKLEEFASYDNEIKAHGTARIILSYDKYTNEINGITIKPQLNKEVLVENIATPPNMHTVRVDELELIPSYTASTTEEINEGKTFVMRGRARKVYREQSPSLNNLENMATAGAGIYWSKDGLITQVDRITGETQKEGGIEIKPEKAQELKDDLVRSIWHINNALVNKDARGKISQDVIDFHDQFIGQFPTAGHLVEYVNSGGAPLDIYVLGDVMYTEHYHHSTSGFYKLEQIDLSNIIINVETVPDAQRVGPDSYVPTEPNPTRYLYGLDGWANIDFCDNMVRFNSIQTTEGNKVFTITLSNQNYDDQDENRRNFSFFEEGQSPEDRLAAVNQLFGAFFAHIHNTNPERDTRVITDPVDRITQISILDYQMFISGKAPAFHPLLSPEVYLDLAKPENGYFQIGN